MKRLLLTMAMAVLAWYGTVAQNYTDSLGNDTQTVARTDSSTWKGRPWLYDGTGRGWGLHEGLNVQLDLSAFVTVGKHVPHRGGFGERLSATWLQSLADKLWVAAGGYVQNTSWGGDSYRDAAFYGVLGYRFDEHWEAYVYGQKHVAGNYASRWGRYGPFVGYASSFGPGMYGVSGMDRLGAAVRYNVNPSLSFQVSVERDWAPKRTGDTYFDQHNYPLPPK